MLISTDSRVAHEDRIGMRQIHREEVDLALDAADHTVASPKSA
jgi:hypothetical protein